MSCQAPSSGLRAAVELLEPRHRAHQLPFPKSWNHFQKLRKKSHNDQEKRRTQKRIPVPGKVPNRFDPQHAPGICSFPLCCYSTMNHKKGWRIQAGESSQWDYHSLQCRRKILFTRVQERWPQFGTNRKEYKYIPLPIQYSLEGEAKVYQFQTRNK